MYSELNLDVKTEVRCYRIYTVRVTRTMRDLTGEIDAIIDGIKVYRATVGEFTAPDATEKLNSQIDALPEEYMLTTGDELTLKGDVESSMPLRLVDSTGNEIFTKPVTYIKIDLTN